MRAEAAGSLARMSATLPSSDRVVTLMERERARYRERTARSSEYYARAGRVMPGGVPSQFQKNDPWPVYIDRGAGSKVWDVDGNKIRGTLGGHPVRASDFN